MKLKFLFFKKMILRNIEDPVLDLKNMSFKIKRMLDLLKKAGNKTHDPREF